MTPNERLSLIHLSKGGMQRMNQEYTDLTVRSNRDRLEVDFTSEYQKRNLIQRNVTESN